MVLAASSQIGGFKPMTTVQLNTSFLRPIPGSQTETVGEAKVVARVLRAGKSLVFGEIEVFDPQGRVAAHATTTYALL
jgi:acyl-coenzyme A thioesterase PaaI-like protein